MERQGPPLEELLRRIADTPDEFLLEPRIGARGTIEVAAVAADLCRQLGGAPETQQVAPMGAAGRNQQAVSLLLCWLLAGEWLEALKPTPGAVLDLLVAGVGDLGETPVERYRLDPERREELARFALARLGLRPRGETVAQAEDRLAALSAAERHRVMAAARAAEERSRAIREALARKAAEESADKWTRE